MTRLYGYYWCYAIVFVVVFCINRYVWYFYVVLGVFGVMYDGYLTNAEEDVEGAIPVIIKTVKGKESSM